MEIVTQLLPVLARTLEIYSLILLVRVLLSWFPNLDWSSNPVLATVSSITAGPLSGVSIARGGSVLHLTSSSPITGT